MSLQIRRELCDVKRNRCTLYENKFVENPSMSVLSVESASHACTALSISAERPRQRLPRPFSYRTRRTLQ
jgi:hypothetical protein